MNTMDRITIQILQSEVELTSEAIALAYNVYINATGVESAEAMVNVTKLQEDHRALTRVIKILEERDG